MQETHGKMMTSGMTPQNNKFPSGIKPFSRAWPQRSNGKRIRRGRGVPQQNNTVQTQSSLDEQSWLAPAKRIAGILWVCLMPYKAGDVAVPQGDACQAGVATDRVRARLLLAKEAALPYSKARGISG